MHLLDSGELHLVGEFEGITCRVVRPPMPPTPWSTVVVYNYSYEFPNELVETVMSGYGEVGDVWFQSWVGLPGVSTATRLVRMHCKCRIPRFLYMGNFRCKVWYKGQPIICDICDMEGHTAGTCPDNGKCRLCHQPGHMARSCPEYRYRCKGSHPGVDCPRVWGHRPLTIVDEGVDTTDCPSLGSTLDGHLDGLSGPASDGPEPPSAADPPTDDLRDNQLDELGSQRSESWISQSIFLNLSASNPSSNSTNNVANGTGIDKEIDNISNDKTNSGSKERNVIFSGTSSLGSQNVDQPIQIGDNQINGQISAGPIGASQIGGSLGVGQSNSEASSLAAPTGDLPLVSSSGNIIPVIVEGEIHDASGARKRPAADLSEDSGDASGASKESVASRSTKKPKSSRLPTPKSHMPGSSSVISTRASTSPSSRS